MSGRGGRLGIGSISSRPSNAQRSPLRDRREMPSAGAVSVVQLKAASRPRIQACHSVVEISIRFSVLHTIAFPAQPARRGRRSW
jgi:hypothetical protein